MQLGLFINHLTFIAGLLFAAARTGQHTGDGLAASVEGPGFAAHLILVRTLDAIAGRYGERTTDIVAMQLEYPQPD